MSKTINKNFEKISRRGCVEYLSSWAEALQEKINEVPSGSISVLLWEEQLAFLTQAVKELREPNKLHSVKEPIFLPEMPHPKILKSFLSTAITEGRALVIDEVIVFVPEQMK